jgi:hypothetical protein
MQWRNKFQFTVYFCVCITLVTLAFLFSTPPFEGSGSQKYLAETREGKLALQIFDDLSKKNMSNLNAQLNLKTSKMTLAQIERTESDAEHYIEQNQLMFVQFSSYSSKQVGDVVKSQISGWFKSKNTPDLFVKVDGTFHGSPTEIFLDHVNYLPVTAKLDFSDPVNLFRLSQLHKVSSLKILAIFLALASLCVSGVAFTHCLMNWKLSESKRWAIPCLIGISPVSVQLWGNASIWEFATIIGPAGWLAKPFFAFGVSITLEGQSETNIAGQMAVISFPFAILYFLRLRINKFNSDVEAKKKNSLRGE